MNLKCLSTGSKGNCYLLSSGTETLIIEAGIPYKRILKGLDFNLMDVVGVVISHTHQDHSKSAEDFKRAGIPVFDSYDSEVEKQVRTYGKFVIYSFKLEHDVPCMGFYILHPDMGSFVYLTDTEYCKYRFPNVNHILIEANYDARLIPEDHPARIHILKGHMELQTTKGFIQANKSSELRNVVLCHMSEDNMDYAVMQKEVSEVAGKRVNIIVAESGLDVELSKFPF